MSLFAAHNRKPIFEFTVALAATVVVASLVIADGHIPSIFTTILFAPIIVLAYRHPLPFSLVVAVVASLASSPAMGVFGVQMNETVMPVLAPRQVARGQLWAYARDDRPWRGSDPPGVA